MIFHDAQEQIKTSPPPPPIPPQPPQQIGMPPGQLYHRKPPSRMKVKIFGVLTVLLLVVMLPTYLLYSRQQQNNQSSAHTPQPSVTAACQSGSVVLTSNYLITNVPSEVTCKVTAIDSENYLDDNFSVQNNGTHQKSANTHKPTIPSGVVTFNTTCTDNFKQTNSASYSSMKPCISPTPTITPTQKLTPIVTPSPTLTPTPTLIPTPSACITPDQVQNVQITCPNCK